ncbi:uncharacterized protein [Halyomorpha halys]|uniref:uncharacterized protein n=1 Tax=Halyomorpha halys TaxID=286706 RepID=UPI0006D4FF33|nr:uncharacterized protein LOC106687249 [Halyomorpha halys]
MHILVVVLCCSLAFGITYTQELDETMDISNSIQTDLREGEEISDPDQLSEYLSSLLMDETAPLPLVYLPEKRSRYYRRYPWKRQNGRNYEPDSYLCTPSRQDVFHLLMALHDARSGNQDRTVHFCNRRRPARAIFTNIRFLGKR